MKVGIIVTGAANMASVRAALGRAGAEPVLVHTEATMRRLDRLVLPGVGAFGPAMEGLRDRGLVAPIREHIDRSRPLLAICLGLQLLFDGSDESPDAPGLGVFAGRAERFSDAVVVPQMGWNRVRTPRSQLLRDGWAYFANSYRVAPVEDAATSDHGGPFVAAIERGPLLACQFHPELSGTWGQALLQRWLSC